jgi:hypothetical protein
MQLGEFRELPSGPGEESFESTPLTLRRAEIGAQNLPVRQLALHAGLEGFDVEHGRQRVGVMVTLLHPSRRSCGEPTGQDLEVLHPHVQRCHERQEILAIVVELLGQRGELGGHGALCRGRGAPSKVRQGASPAEMVVQVRPQRLALLIEFVLHGQSRHPPARVG